MRKSAAPLLVLCVFFFAVVKSHESRGTEEDEAFKDLALQYDQSDAKPSLEVCLKPFFNCLAQNKGHGDKTICTNKFHGICKFSAYMTECTEKLTKCVGDKKLSGCLKDFNTCIEGNEPGSNSQPQ